MLRKNFKRAKARRQAKALEQVKRRIAEYGKMEHPHDSDRLAQAKSERDSLNRKLKYV